MKKKSFIYNLINILALLATAVILYFEYGLGKIFNGEDLLYVGVVGVSVIIVHFLKAVRLFLALHGTEISFTEYLKIYCKVTPVSILFPFKIGEFFRMYCYGIQTGKKLRGVLTVILDRFMDTIALLTMIIIVLAINGGEIPLLMYFLIAFIVVAVSVYVIFPGGYQYWNEYLLKADSTVRKIKVLNLLNKLNMVYREIMRITQGRGIIMYTLSIVAWGVEIGAIALLSKINGEQNVSNKIKTYLSSALSITQTRELKQFIFLSVILMIVIYILVKLIELSRKNNHI